MGEYAADAAARVWAEGGITLVVDMVQGRLSMMDEAGMEAGYWLVEGLNDKEVVFAASMYGTQKLLMELPNFPVTVTSYDTSSGIQVAFHNIAGDELKVIDLENAEDMKMSD